jgi:hypothetical protein
MNTYVAWTPRSEYRLDDGSTVIGRTNYTNSEIVEVRTDCGAFRSLQRTEILHTRKITGDEATTSMPEWDYDELAAEVAAVNAAGREWRAA